MSSLVVALETFFSKTVSALAAKAASAAAPEPETAMDDGELKSGAAVTEDASEPSALGHDGIGLIFGKVGAAVVLLRRQIEREELLRERVGEALCRRGEPAGIVEAAARGRRC